MSPLLPQLQSVHKYKFMQTYGFSMLYYYSPILSSHKIDSLIFIICPSTSLVGVGGSRKGVALASCCCDIVDNN